MEFLTSLLAGIIRPIIQDELNKLKGEIVKMMGRLDIYKERDAQAVALSAEMAEASTKEERYAILQKLKENQPKFS